MKNEKEPHITMIWIAIAVLSINQAIGAYRCHESHQLLWERLIRQSEIEKSHIESTNQFLEELSQIIESHYK